MTRLPDNFWPEPRRRYRSRGWSSRRRYVARRILGWLATLAVYVLICVEIFVAVVILLPGPPR